MILRGPSLPALLRDENLGEILRQTAADRPGQVALVDGGRRITYGELLRLAENLARGLDGLGAGPGGIVGLWMPRGADLLIAQAGIAVSGAAWLPFDADTPVERVETCLGLSGALGVLTSRDRVEILTSRGIRAWACEDLLANAASAARRPRRAAPNDLAYVIYTSGSTGTPKGIAISQRNICHFLRSENAVLGVRGDDVVYQGFSVAFDMSFEEIWISYLVGATVWIAPPAVVSDPQALAEAVNRAGVTVLHAVPTLMSLVTDPLPGVRLINLGGEACPPGLVAPLSRPGRKLFNTYGPTETTVTATLAELQPGDAVTIGLPLPNYGVMIVDDALRLVAPGEVGQLAVFGPGLAEGYLGLPELTAAKFIANPHAAGPGDARLYLTGDLASMPAGGPVTCLGRLDDQVKLRGFRIELGEIETRLADEEGVGAAAVLVRAVQDIDQLIGYVVPKAGQSVDPSRLRQQLARKLPNYMVPAHVEVLSEMPRLSSGKIDRRRLRELPITLRSTAAQGTPEGPDETALHEAVGKVLPGAGWDPAADFFTDLGGHSLLAARLASLLRGRTEYGSLSVSDLYRERTLGRIATVLARLRAGGGATRVSARPPAPRLRHALCGLAQTLCLPFLVLWHMGSWLAPFFTYHFNTGEPGDSVLRAVAWALLVFVGIELSSFAVAILGKRLLLGSLRPGRYPLWGFTYFRYWLSEKLGALAPVRLLHGTPWLRVYLRLLGARIGRDVFIDSLTVSVPELLEIGDGADIGSSVIIANARVVDGELAIGPVVISRHANVETNCVLEEDTGLGDDARLGAMSALASGRKVPAGEHWTGAPARPADAAAEPPPPRPRHGPLRRAITAGFYALATFAIACLFFLPVFPVFMLIDALDARYFDIFESDAGPAFAFGFFFLLAIPASALLVFLTALLTAGLKRAFVPAQTEGRWGVDSTTYVRKWLVTRLLDASLETMHGLYASVFAAAWLRLLGARVGTNTEVSTATGVIPDLLEIGRDSFVADGVTLGDEEQRGGWMTLRRTCVGERSFLGNGAYVADGTVVPHDVLIGVQTRAPENARMSPGQVWLGSPALLLPAREGDLGFDRSLTFQPSPARRLARAAIETLRIVLPMAFVIAAGYLVVHASMPYAEDEEWLGLARLLAFCGFLYGVASFLLVVLLKWLLIGRYQTSAHPMWSPFVWVSEAVTNVYESLAVPNFLDFLRGTPLLPAALRLLGARFGRRVFLDTTDLTEFDCVEVGDDCELNFGCGPQTHLFEDRVMKIGDVRVGRRVRVGAGSTILYGTEVGDDVALGPLTLVSKGEQLPAGTRWEGSPAAPAR